MQNVYTSTGEANIELPAGSYELIASRGLEYSIARSKVEMVAGDQAEVALAIRREVNTSGWVACDTHIHTLTHSLHGDATVQERMITLAGEGIELPIATDHNRHIDYESSSREANVRKYFTPVVGNQLTASVAALESFDETVAIQVALLLHGAGTPPMQLLDGTLLPNQTDATKRGFMAYVTAWRANEIARAQ